MAGKRGMRNREGTQQHNKLLLFGAMSTVKADAASFDLVFAAGLSMKHQVDQQIITRLGFLSGLRFGRSSSPINQIMI